MDASSSSRSSSSRPSSSPASSSSSGRLVVAIVQAPSRSAASRRARRSACRPRPARASRCRCRRRSRRRRSRRRRGSPSSVGVRVAREVLRQRLAGVVQAVAVRILGAVAGAVAVGVAAGAGRCARPPRRRWRGGRGRSPRRRRRRRRGRSRRGCGLVCARHSPQFVRPSRSGSALAARALNCFAQGLGSAWAARASAPWRSRWVGGRRPGEGQATRARRARAARRRERCGSCGLLHEGGAVRGPSPCSSAGRRRPGCGGPSWTKRGAPMAPLSGPPLPWRAA